MLFTLPTKCEQLKSRLIFNLYFCSPPGQVSILSGDRFLCNLSDVPALNYLNLNLIYE